MPRIFYSKALLSSVISVPLSFFVFVPIDVLLQCSHTNPRQGAAELLGPELALP
jgi:hypothetical protein